MFLRFSDPCRRLSPTMWFRHGTFITRSILLPSTPGDFVEQVLRKHSIFRERYGCRSSFRLHCLRLTKFRLRDSSLNPSLWSGCGFPVLKEGEGRPESTTRFDLSLPRPFGNEKKKECRERFYP